MLIPALFALASDDIFFNASADVHTRYIFRGYTPAGKQPSASLNFSAFFSKANINISQWYVNSLSHISDYHEYGTMVSYYHYFTDRLISSAGLTLYLLPDVAQTPLANVEMSFTFTDIEFIIPYFVETYFDFVLKSWYIKLTAGYTIETFLPINFAVITGLNVLPYDRFGISFPAGFSNISLQLNTYISLKKWQVSPKISYIIPNTLIYPNHILQASVNLGYSF